MLMLFKRDLDHSIVVSCNYSHSMVPYADFKRPVLYFMRYNPLQHCDTSPLLALLPSTIYSVTSPHQMHPGLTFHFILVYFVCFLLIYSLHSSADHSALMQMSSTILLSIVQHWIISDLLCDKQWNYGIIGDHSVKEKRRFIQWHY